ncbi:MAG: DUF1330 domain-containing protein [Thermoplasmata archaeon]
MVQIEWHDRGKAKEYGEKQSQLLRKFGGRTLYAGAPQALEGSWTPPGMVIDEFPTMDALRAWYTSAEYAPLLRLRKQWATTNLIAVEEPVARSDIRRKVPNLTRSERRARP